MKTRRVFSAPDIDTAEAALHVALHMGIQPDHAALVGRPEIEMTQMPDDEKEGSPTDFMPAAMRGLIGGGVVGLVVGLLAMAIPAVGIPLVAVLLCTLVGALVGGPRRWPVRPYPVRSAAISAARSKRARCWS
jgi:predicted lipid-binding transport protein (Tim44 family)